MTRGCRASSGTRPNGSGNACGNLIRFSAVPPGYSQPHHKLDFSRLYTRPSRVLFAGHGRAQCLLPGFDEVLSERMPKAQFVLRCSAWFVWNEKSLACYYPKCCAPSCQPFTQARALLSLILNIKACLLYASRQMLGE